MEVDYTPALQLEYTLRYQALEKSLYKEWNKNKDGLSLEEFTKEMIRQNTQSSTRN